MTTFFHWFVAVYLVLSDVHTFYSLPTIDDKAIDFLRSFGYLPPKKSNDGISADDILHEDVLTSAIKRMQQFGHIEQTGVMDAATKELLKKPRCGNKDFEWSEPSTSENGNRKKRYAIGHTKWERHNLKWSFSNINHKRDRHEESQIIRLIAEAMSIWEHSSVLKMERVHDEDADIRIDFARGKHGDSYDFTGPGENLAHAFYPGTGIGGDVHMDEDESWDIEDGKGGDISFFLTLLHELGHSFGLNHSNNTESIMYPYYMSDRKFDRQCKALYDDDIIGIAQVYGAKSEFRYGRRCADRSNPDAVTQVPNYRTRRPTERQTTERVQIQTYLPDPQPPRTDPRTRRPEHNTRRPESNPRRPEHNPYTPRYETTIEEKPDRCNTSIDAIAYLRNELMVFKGKWLWRLLKDPSTGRPYVEEGKISSMWRDLGSYDHIDAAIEMKNGNFAFFTGRKIFIYSGHKLVGTSDLTHYGFDHRLKKVDAIFKWSHNNNTFVFSGKYYWRVDENLRVNSAENKEYPRIIGQTYWKGVDMIDVDTALTDGDTTYFLSGHLAYKFNGYSQLELDKPIVTSKKWMQCEYSEQELMGIHASARVQTSDAPPTTRATTISPSTTKKPKKFRWYGYIFAEPIDPHNLNKTAIAQDLFLKPTNNSLIDVN